MKTTVAPTNVNGTEDKITSAVTPINLNLKTNAGQAVECLLHHKFPLRIHNIPTTSQTLTGGGLTHHSLDFS